MNVEKLYRLVEIRNEMTTLLKEAEELIDACGNAQVRNASKAFWLGQIGVGLGDGEYVDMHGYSFQKALKELGWNETTQAKLDSK